MCAAAPAAPEPGDGGFASSIPLCSPYLSSSGGAAVATGSRRAGGLIWGGRRRLGLARDVAWRGEVTAGAAEVDGGGGREGEGEGEVGTGRRARRGGRSREWALLGAVGGWVNLCVGAPLPAGRVGLGLACVHSQSWPRLLRATDGAGDGDGDWRRTESLVLLWRWRRSVE